MVGWQGCGDTDGREALGGKARFPSGWLQFEMPRNQEYLNITGKDWTSTCKIRIAMPTPTEYSKFAYMCIPLFGSLFDLETFSDYLCNYEKHNFSHVFFYILKINVALERCFFNHS